MSSEPDYPDAQEFVSSGEVRQPAEPGSAVKLAPLERRIHATWPRYLD